ncbi:MAG TPA: hypothetical protein VFW66_14420 [Gemmatimonadales bacterium]|nr:hypothetical protein [Gemmatimonadales bacterium]
MSDTQPEAARRYRDMMRAHSGAERFVMGTGMFETARLLAIASFPPALSPDELRRRLFARFYGDLPPEQVPPSLRNP